MQEPAHRLLLALYLTCAAELVRGVRIRGPRPTPQLPSKPGCYVWAPVGCNLNRYFDSKAWRRDWVGERDENAKVSQTACEGRIEHFKHVCENEEVRVVFVYPGGSVAGGAGAEFLAGPAQAAAAAAALPPLGEASGSSGALEESEGSSAPGISMAKSSRKKKALSSVELDRARTRQISQDLMAEVLWANDGHPEAVGAAPAGAEEAGSSTPEDGARLARVEQEKAFVEKLGGERVEQQAVGERDTQQVVNEELWTPAYIEVPGNTTIERLNASADKVAVEVPDISAAPVSPTEAGCYVWAPSGCPNNPDFEAKNWTHDKHGEVHLGAQRNPAICAKREASFRQWCGIWDVHTLYIKSRLWAEGTPEVPGCHVLVRTICPKHPLYRTGIWKRDLYGEEQFEAGENRTACEVGRKRSFAVWCGINDIQALFIPKPEPGCYVKAPLGCPKFPSFKATAWRHDKDGEKWWHAGASKDACEVERKQRLMDMCGTQAIEMRFIENQTLTALLRNQTGADSGLPAISAAPAAATNASRNASGASGGGAKKGGGNWAKQQFVAAERRTPPSDPPAPTEPGCYMLAPNGCPADEKFEAKTWKRDYFGEMKRMAHLDRDRCEDERQSVLSSWCRTDDFYTIFVPNVTANVSRVEEQ